MSVCCTPAILSTFFISQDTLSSGAPTKPTQLPAATAATTAGPPPSSRTDDEDQPQPTRKKIVLVRKRSQALAAVPTSVTQAGRDLAVPTSVTQAGRDHTLLSVEAVVKNESVEASRGENSEASIVHDDTGVRVKTIEGTPEAKRMKLSRPSKEAVTEFVEAIHGGNSEVAMVHFDTEVQVRTVKVAPDAKRIKLSRPSKEGVSQGSRICTQSQPPVNIDTTCIERSAPLEESGKTSVQESSLSAVTIEDSSQAVHGSKPVGKTDRVQPRELSVGLSERKDSIDIELEGLLSPAVEDGKEEEEEARRASGSKRQSIAEMKAEMYVPLLVLASTVMS